MTFFAVRRWVQWWFWVGLVIGVAVMSIIFGNGLKGQNEAVALAMGVIYWALGGFVCWGCKGIEPVSLSEIKAEENGLPTEPLHVRTEPDERLGEFYSR